MIGCTKLKTVYSHSVRQSPRRIRMGRTPYILNNAGQIESNILFPQYMYCNTMIVNNCLLQDMHCPHLFKLGAKLQACQESVSDPSDLVHSLKVRLIFQENSFLTQLIFNFRKFPPCQCSMTHVHSYLILYTGLCYILIFVVKSTF